MRLEDVPQNSSIFDEERMKYFIKFRKISTEDFGIIEQLAELAKNHKRDLVSNFHNYFLFSLQEEKEQVLKRIKYYLENAKKNGSEEQHVLRFYELFMEFIDKYDHHAAHNLERVLEKL